MVGKQNILVRVVFCFFCVVGFFFLIARNNLGVDNENGEELNLNFLNDRVKRGNCGERNNDKITQNRLVGGFCLLPRIWQREHH